MKKIILITLLFQTILSFSQEMFKIDYTFTDMNNYSCNSTLFTNNNEAVFKIYDERQAGLVEIKENVTIDVNNDGLSKFFFSNNEFVYYRFPFEKREIIYKDDCSRKINWKINSDKKLKIGKYDCTEAKLTINGRSFTAWFTFDVPIKYGPLKLHGLPGLIVEVSEDNGYLKMKLNELSKTKDLIEFNKYKNYFLKQKTIMNYKEYENKISEIVVSMRMRGLAYVKEMNYEGVSFNDDVTKDSYIDIPDNLLNELKKLH